MTLAKKQEQKRQETVSFVCLGLGAKAPFGQTIVAQANCKFRQTAHTFMIVKYSVLYFDAVYQERSYGKQIDKEAGEIK